MSDKAGTEATRADAPDADDSPGGGAVEDKPAAAAAAPVAEGAGDEAAQDARDSDDSGDKTPQSEDLKVVVSIKGGRAIIGVQRPSADPHIETFDGHDLSGLAHEVLAVIERAKAGWEVEPKHPAYVRPAPPARRRNRRRQGTAQAPTAGEGEAQQHQQQMPRLF